MKRYGIRRYSWKLGLLLGAVFLFLAGCGRKEEEKEKPREREPEPLVLIEEEKEEEPQPEEAPEEEPEETLADLRLQIEEVVRAEEGKGDKMAVYVEDLSSGESVSVGNQQMESASVIKLYIAGCVYENLEKVRAQESYAQETDSLLEKMITVSDNDAANALVTRLGQGDAAAGMQAVNTFCKNHGFLETHMGRLMLDFSAADDNFTSVNDCGKLLRAIYQGELAGSSEILAAMKRQERTGKIPAGVPQGVETANKTGELDTVENDVAFVYADSGAYTICVMMSDLYDTAEARSAIVALSSQVYTYMQTEK